MTIDKPNVVSGRSGEIAAPKKEAAKKAPKGEESSDPKVTTSPDTAKTSETESGKYNDYQVDSDYELIISVKSRQTDEEIRQIPTKEHQAVKQAISKTVDKLIDKMA